MMGFRPPLTMGGRFIRLIPLSRNHIPALALAGKDPEIWQWMQYGYTGTEEAMGRHVDLLLARQALESDLAFTILLRPDDRPVGMTRYLGIDRLNRNVEVGGTWLESGLWRSPVNSESKLLMLSNAFESEGCERVQIKTDLRNVRSQRAIERLGAQREGVLRQHMVRSDGTLRDSVVYSVLRAEWPAMRQRLVRVVERPWARPAGV
ncbi:MAG: GNAT family N-acetyltransferase [Thermoplasmata archaeon]|nr:GNAT family N-acetyltransferase [Thermoplasmata archaeon]